MTAATLVASSFGVISGAFQAHILGPADRGQLAIAMTPGVVLSILLCFGLPDYVTRATARGIETRHLSTVALVAATATGVIFIGPYFLLASAISDSVFDVWVLLVLFGLTLPLYIYGYCLASIAAGAGLWRWVAGLRALAPLISVLGLAVIYTAGDRAQGVLVVGLFLLGVSATAPLALLFSKQLRPTRLPAREVLGSLGQAYHFGFRSWASGSIAFLNQRVDLLLVTVLASATDVGFYAVSVSLAAVITAAVNAFIAPMRNRVARDGLSGVEKECVRLFWTIVVLVSILLAVLPWLIYIVLGASFAPARGIMSVLMIGQIPLAVVIVLTQSLISAGRPAAPLVGEAVALVATVAFTLLFFGQLGTYAAGLGSIIGTLLSGVWLVLLYRRYSGLAARHLFLPSSRRGKASKIVLEN